MWASGLDRAGMVKLLLDNGAGMEMRDEVMKE